MTATVPAPPVSAPLPLIARFPALAAIPRVRIGQWPTPVTVVEGFRDVPRIWVKRDDLSSPELGGNKVRALEFLLGRVASGDTLFTIGGLGSTHALALAFHAGRLGARVTCFRWPHDRHLVADEVGARVASLASRTIDTPHIALAYLGALAWRIAGRGGWIPLGGTSPLGVLGHVNGALELADQVRAGQMPTPGVVVVPLGTGGTAAGLALGFAIAGLPVTVLGARVGPRIGANLRHVRSVIASTGQLIRHYTGREPPVVPRDRLAIAHGAYGGAYGRPFHPAQQAAALLHTLVGWRLDATYSAKGLLVALDAASRTHEPVLFWLTFDGRWLRAESAASDPAAPSSQPRDPGPP